MPPLTFLFESKDTTTLGIISPKNEIKKTLNSSLRLCPNLAKETIQIGFEFKSLITTKHVTHLSKLNLTATVANHHLNSHSLLQATMTPLPYRRHQEVYDPKQNQTHIPSTTFIPCILDWDHSC